MKSDWQRVLSLTELFQVLIKMSFKNYTWIIDLRLSWSVEIRNSPVITAFTTSEKWTVMSSNVLLLILLNMCLIKNCLTFYLKRHGICYIYIGTCNIYMCIYVYVYIYIYIYICHPWYILNQWDSWLWKPGINLEQIALGRQHPTNYLT